MAKALGVSPGLFLLGGDWCNLKCTRYKGAKSGGWLCETAKIPVANRIFSRWVGVTLAFAITMAAGFALLRFWQPSIIEFSTIESTSLQPNTRAQQIAVIYNSRDSLSKEIAHYYQSRRNVPPENVIAVSFDPDLQTLPVEIFQAIKQKVDAQTPSHVQFYALAWAKTVRVECMSITSAFAFGFIPGPGDGSCQNTCALGQMNPYASGLITQPWQQLNMRPTMMLAAHSLADAKALIDRGIEADGHLLASSSDSARAYLLSTSDSHRNVRRVDFPRAHMLLSSSIPVDIISAYHIENRTDVMFYFTGVKNVAGLSTLGFAPGAIADHLTSFGGLPLVESGKKPIKNNQMSAMEWLQAGATGSYGTVVEPCNHLQKFPQPSVVMDHYLRGDSLIEAYWKSVKAPGQGVFIGEPLARPYGI